MFIKYYIWKIKTWIKLRNVTSKRGVWIRVEPARISVFLKNSLSVYWVWNCENIISSVQSLSCVWLFVTPWTTAHQASLSITNSRSLLKLISFLRWWCHPTISSSVAPLSSCLQSFPAKHYTELSLHVNPWLIHVNVWQKPLQYCKVISLQLIKIKKN